MNRAGARAQVRRRGAAVLAPEPASEAELEATQMVSAPAAVPRPDESDEPDVPSAGATSAPEVMRVGYAPIVRVDAERREIELCATSEAVDSYGTVFDYEASKAAFARWIGNVREMHARRAVGRRVAVHCDDGARRIYVRVRISAGAQDTWEKIGDGTLRGASIGASNVVWTFQTRRVAGRDQVVQVATAYELVELSLVDNPSNPDALGIAIVRATEPVETLLAELDDTAADVAGGTEGAGPRRGEERSTTEAMEATEEREDRAEGKQGGIAANAEDAGVRDGDRETAAEHRGRGENLVKAERARGPFSDNAAGAPDMGVPARAPEPATVEMPAAGNARERFHAAARGILLGCGCGLCEAALAALGAPPAADDAATAEDRMAVGAVREAALARAVAAGLAAETRQMERMEASVRALSDTLHAALGGMGTTLETTLGDLRARLERIESQPLPGGPALRAVEKSHALAAPGVSDVAPASPAEQYRVLEALAGKLSDPQAQIAVAAELIRLRAREGR